MEHACSILTKAEVAKYIARGRPMDDFAGDEIPGICAYNAGSGQVIVYSGPNAEERFDRLLKSFKKDKEPRYPLESLGPDAWVMYPRPDDKYQAIGAFTEQVSDLAHLADRFVAEEVSEQDVKYMAQRAYNAHRGKHAYEAKLSRRSQS